MTVPRCFDFRYLVKHTEYCVPLALVILPSIRLESASTMSPKQEVASREQVVKSILLIRGLKVMLEADVARLYGVFLKRLNEQVHRNLRRFPSDFVIHLTREEYEGLRSQFATLNLGRGSTGNFSPAQKKPIERYDGKGKRRINNPPVGVGDTGHGFLSLA